MKAILTLSKLEYFAKYGFKTTRFDAFELKNGLVMVVFDYSAPPEFKYSEELSFGFGSENGLYYEHADFAFNSAPKYRLYNLRIAPYFTIELKSKLHYSYLYSRQTKYGIVVYFAPDEFDAMDGAKSIAAEII